MYGVTVAYENAAIESNAHALASIEKDNDNVLSKADVVVEGG